MAGRVLEPGYCIGGRYHIVRFLAKGGMASVYEVEHRLTEKRLALKVLHSDILDNQAARDSFEFEAKVAARVDSEHVVQVHDAGVEHLETGEAPYLVMELLSGETLEQVSKREGPLSPETVLPWLRQISSGLDAAHRHENAEGEAQPIIHRDLKPDNLFLHQASTGPIVKILDFGIAKLITRSAQTSQVIRGTPLYISYEQLTGRRVSPATDIWSLGLITFTLLGGRSFWLAGSREGSRPESLFAEIVTLPIEPPSARLQALGLAGTLNPGFDDWFLRCIDRDMAKRFASAGEAVEALASVLEGQAPLVAMKPSSGEVGGATSGSSAPRAALPDETLPSSVPGSPSDGPVMDAPSAVAETPLLESHPAYSSGRPAAPPRGARRAPRWAIAAVLLGGLAAWLGFRNIREPSPATVEPTAPVGAAHEPSPVKAAAVREPAPDPPEAPRVTAASTEPSAVAAPSENESESERPTAEPPPGAASAKPRQPRPPAKAKANQKVLSQASASVPAPVPRPVTKPKPSKQPADAFSVY